MKKIIFFALWLVITSLALFLFSCCDPEIEKPRITIIDCEDVTDTSAVIVGEILSDGGAAILEVGAVVYPDREVLFEGGKGLGQFSIQINGLKPNTDYQISVYATNIAGKSSGGWISFTTNEITPIEYKFSIPGTSMTDVITDSQGNVYVAGIFGGMDIRDDCFVTKFGSEGELIWRTDIVAERFNYPEGGMAIDEINGLIYVHGAEDDSGIGNGYPHLYSLQCGDGKINWRLKLSDESSSAKAIAIDKKGNPISLVGQNLLEISSAGNINRVNYFSFLDDICFFGDNLLLSGEQSLPSNSIESVVVIKMINEDWHEQWKHLRQDENYPCFSSKRIVVFPEDSLIISAERGSIPGDWFKNQTQIICYQIEAQGLGLKWKKTFSDDMMISLKKIDNNRIVVFTPTGYENGTASDITIFNLAGEVIRKIAPISGQVAQGKDGKILIANCGNALLCY